METTFRNIDNAKMFTQLNSYNLIFKLLILQLKEVLSLLEYWHFQSRRTLLNLFQTGNKNVYYNNTM